jgi:peptide/nickel transport system permease protein
MSGSRPMLRYVARRLLALPPLLLGVILITFVLFNVVGGSPAATVLGKSATAQSLEEFDEQHGFNKPLLFGRFTPTRAFATPDFSRGATPWTTNDAVSLAAATPGSPAALVLAGRDTEHAIPLAFPLRPRTFYRWTIRYKTDSFFMLNARQTREGAVLREDPFQVPPPRMDRLPQRIPRRRFHPDRILTARMDYRTGDDPSSESFHLWVAGTDLRIVGIELHRRMPHPFDSQFAHYVLGLLRLDFGLSTEANEKVSRLLREGVVPSLCLTIPIFVGTLLLSLVLSLVAAWYRNRLPDRALVAAATLLMSVNYVVWVIAGQYVLAYRLEWFPVWGFESWSYLLLPVLIGIATGVGRDLRFYRTMILDEMYRDYVRTARAKGASTSRILLRHVLPNVMIPVITNVSINLPFLFTGSLLLETYFGIPGLGNLSLNAIHASDVNVVRAIVIIGAVLYVFANLLADLAYGFVDPRARIE